MNLWQIQSTLKTLLEAQSELSGVTILTEDGSYPQTPGREAALASPGLCLIISLPRGTETNVATEAGWATYGVEVNVLVEENVSVNRTGTYKTAEELAHYVMEATAGGPTPNSQFDRFIIASPAFEHFGKIDGVNRVAVHLRTDCELNPLT